MRKGICETRRARRGRGEETMNTKTIEEYAIAAAVADGWELDRSPATEMSNETWYRRCPTQAAMREEDIIERYWSSLPNVLLADIVTAREENRELRAWKESALAVEREWDAQAIAKLLGAKLGQSCRAVIADKVPKLAADLAAARKENESTCERGESEPQPERPGEPSDFRGAIRRMREAEAALAAAREEANELSRDLAGAQVERDQVMGELAAALIISFIQGAQWWEWKDKGATMWPSDRDLAEAAARERLANNKLGEPTP